MTTDDIMALADALEAIHYHNADSLLALNVIRQAGPELRRLHAENETLRAALAEQADDARCLELLEAFDDAPKPKPAEQEQPLPFNHNERPKQSSKPQAPPMPPKPYTAPQPVKPAAQQALEASDYSGVREFWASDDAGIYEFWARDKEAEQPEQEAVGREDAPAKPASEADLQVYRAIAENYYRNTAPQPAIPPGYKLVPVEPTPEMLATTLNPPLSRDIYCAMVDAAPEAPQSKPAEQEPVAYLHDDGYWTATKTDAGRRLSERLLFAGSPSIAVYTAPPPAKREQLTDEYKAVLLESRNQAMRLATQGRIPECGAFGGITKE